MLPTPPPAFRVSLRGFFVWITLFCVIFGLGWMLLSSIEQVRHAAMRMSGQGRAKQSILALHFYLDQHRTFPAAQMHSSPGSPPYSWRVAILPYIEQQGLYAQYDQTLAWNAPANAALCRQPGQTGNVGRLFQITGEARQNEHCTDFVLVTGPGTLFPDDGPVSLIDVTDDRATTISFVEIDRSDILWYEPRDLRIDQMSFRINDPDRTRPSIGDRRAKGAIVAMVDGSVRLLPQDTPPETVQAMLTIAGGEEVVLP